MSALGRLPGPSGASAWDATPHKWLGNLASLALVQRVFERLEHRRERRKVAGSSAPGWRAAVRTACPVRRELPRCWPAWLRFYAAHPRRQSRTTTLLRHRHPPARGRRRLACRRRRSCARLSAAITAMRSLPPTLPDSRISRILRSSKAMASSIPLARTRRRRCGSSRPSSHVERDLGRHGARFDRRGLALRTERRAHVATSGLHAGPLAGWLMSRPPCGWLMSRPPCPADAGTPPRVGRRRHSPCRRSPRSRAGPLAGWLMSSPPAAGRAAHRGAARPRRRDPTARGSSPARRQARAQRLIGGPQRPRVRDQRRLLLFEHGQLLLEAGDRRRVGLIRGVIGITLAQVAMAVNRTTSPVASTS